MLSIDAAPLRARRVLAAMIDPVPERVFVTVH
jgi:hypothetical protein